ncbi:MAG: exosome complex protein Rrp4 [Candidatus Thermoplasmatota archaeon]|nr:exosome complex protein Rrp4 [Candidatus Thermoplasmatota archaeon]MBU1941308.1 exosome complex protein Rrp4 [Candidatus Thermoplasmatota archaeon]
MPTDKRTLVIPGQILGDTRSHRAGSGTFIAEGKILSQLVGILNIHGNSIHVVPIKGKYNPIEGDFVIGIVEEAMSSSWLVDINAPSPALLHQNEVPWNVDFGDTERYLNKGDTIMAKVLSVDDIKKLQITLNDRNLYKIKGGFITEVEPTRVPRIIGKKGSMMAVVKKYIRCRIFVGQNGRIWIDGDTDDIEKVRSVIQIIEDESLSFGLTDRIETLLKKDAKDVHV